MFEITPQDIAQLNDEQLRTLIGLLCEAELRSRGYAAASVTWGGNQNAKDGGIDVRVNLPDDQLIDGFIPRRVTGFQVKKQDMPASAIADEMCPAGELRPVIADLADKDGAYIIASSEGSTADSALDRRRSAMADAVGARSDRLVLDFYDRTRLASWVRAHAGLVVWTRNTIGRRIAGWEPFGAWAYPAGGADAEYLLEKGVQLRRRPARSDTVLSTEAALNQIREILCEPRSAVRLVGLSGLGKTRFVQALFDSRVGDRALNPALAVYTNMNNDPSPQPSSLGSDLIATGMRAVLIIDNCPSDLHGRLAELSKSTSSLLGILTIEYDIRDDQPEGTDVFEMQAASTEMIEKLLRMRFQTLSPVDAKTAADFSGGNARIAIALGDTVQRGGTLTSLTDAQLFKRLFSQRNPEDESLLRTAQACSLVYSFNGEDMSEGEEGELIRLAQLTGFAPEQTYHHVAELLRRDLAQRRGRWRAILPHAIANRLAAAALQNIPLERVKSFLVNDAPERLVISFSRRLGYLHESQEAVQIAAEWLKPDGWIGLHIWNLNEFGRKILDNILPASPESGLRSLEAGMPLCSQDNTITTGHYVARTLRLLAWDANLFDRCVAILAILALNGEEVISKEAREIHTSLFRLLLSGTHASGEQRRTWARKLLYSDDARTRALGLEALAAMLQSMRFFSGNNFQFGSRSRDFGYRPKSREDVSEWFKTALALAEEVILSGAPAATGVRHRVSEHFRGLWSSIKLYDELESLCKKIAQEAFWSDGWLAVKQTRYFDAKDKASDEYKRLSSLELLLRPKDLVQRVRGEVLSSRGALYDIDDVATLDNADNFRIAMEKKAEEIVNLGSQLAHDDHAMRELLPEIVGDASTLFHIGVGIARSTDNSKAIWGKLTEHFTSAPAERRGVQIFCGILSQMSNDAPELTDELLEEALQREPLAPYFPNLQVAVPITPRGLDRLIHSLTLAKVPVHRYGSVFLGRAIEVVGGSRIAEYLKQLSAIPEGEGIALHLLSMQFFSDRQSKQPHAPELVTLGRDLLSNVKFDRRQRREDYDMQQLAAACMIGPDAHTVATAICENLKRAVATHETYGFDHGYLIKALFELQPRAVLDALLTGDKKAVDVGRQVIDLTDFQSNPLDFVSDEILFAWCDEHPEPRYPIAASVVSMFTIRKDSQPSTWTPMATRLVHAAPDPLLVMQEFIARCRPMIWSDSRSAILNGNAALLDQFETSGNTALAAYIAAEKEALRNEAQTSLEWETNWDRERDERFE